jgi:type IV pilus assembly protein PilC
MLQKISKFYDTEIDNFVKNISSVIEPVLMLLIGGVIALLAFSIIAPIYSIMSEF